MKKVIFAGFVLIFFAVCAYPQDASDTAADNNITSGNIKVIMTGFRNEKGRAQVALYNSEKGFPLDPNYAYKTISVAIIKGRAVATFYNVPLGKYALSAIHDEDMDGDFDRNWLFLPGEGWGTSNDAGGYFGPGGYQDSRFIIDEREASINIVMHY